MVERRSLVAVALVAGAPIPPGAPAQGWGPGRAGTKVVP